MKMKNEFSNPIKSRTAKISMWAFAILVLLSALTLLGLQLFGFEVPLRIIGIILIFAVIINITEIGLKRITTMSSLKRIGTQQKASLIIALIVFIVAVLFLFNLRIPVISSFASGLLFLEFIVIILEIYN